MSESEREAFGRKEVTDFFGPFDPTLKPSRENFHFNRKNKFLV